MIGWIVLLLTGCSGGCLGPPPDNVIVILIDDIGVDKVGAYGAEYTLSLIHI